MSPVSPLKQIWPEAAEMTPEQMALAALRQEIDALDDALLDLFQQRLALASRVGLAKDAPAGPHTKLRPDREQAVLACMLARAAPDTAEAVEALWREIVGWGLNRRARWDAMTFYDKADFNGTELRAFAGNFLYSTGANEVAGRHTSGHFDLPLRGCTVALDGEPVVDQGRLL